MQLLEIKNITIKDTPFFDFSNGNWNKNLNPQHSFYIYFNARTSNPIPNIVNESREKAIEFLYKLTKHFGIKGYTEQMNNFIDNYVSICQVFYNSFLENKNIVDTTWEPNHYVYNYGTNKLTFEFDFKIAYSQTKLYKCNKKYKPICNSVSYETPKIYYKINVIENIATRG